MDQLTVVRDPADPYVRVLSLHLAGRLGYLRAEDEWVDMQEPLSEVLQLAAHRLVQSGLLPEFEDVAT
jgi:hypothetical protein